MKRHLILLGFGLLTLAVGCVRVIELPPPAATQPEEEPAADPIPDHNPSESDEVTDRVVEACWFMDRSETQDFLALTRIMRASNLRAANALFILSDSCIQARGNALLSDCNRCSVALVDQTYD